MSWSPSPGVQKERRRETDHFFGEDRSGNGGDSRKISNRGGVQGRRQRSFFAAKKARGNPRFNPRNGKDARGFFRAQRKEELEGALDAQPNCGGKVDKGPGGRKSAIGPSGHKKGNMLGAGKPPANQGRSGNKTTGENGNQQEKWEPPPHREVSSWGGKQSSLGVLSPGRIIFKMQVGKGEKKRPATLIIGEGIKRRTSPTQPQVPSDQQ